VPDHATSEIASGSKLGIDATKKLPGEPRKLSGLAAVHQDGCRGEGEGGEVFHKLIATSMKKTVDHFFQVVHIHIKMSKELDMSAGENCVCFNLRWVTRAVTQFYDAEMRRHGIRPTQGSILAALQTKESWNMAELSDWLGMERTTLVRNLRPLQRDGFVKAVGGGRGNRVELTITTKGQKQVEKLTPAWKSAQSAVVKTLGEKRWSAILSDLETAALALNKN
jgi:DNA-binding MarR family transcriptional regulator